MDKRKFTTKQEREQYVQNFLASGKTQLSWCKENNIKLSTLGRWLHNWVHFKRLEKGSIDWPEPSDEEATMNFTLEDFANLLDHQRSCTFKTAYAGDEKGTAGK